MRSLKLVLPCLQQKEKNDNVIQELLGYKFYEVFSPYNFYISGHISFKDKASSNAAAQINV